MISDLRALVGAPAMRHVVLGGVLSLLGYSCTPDFGKLSAGRSGTFSESAGDSANSDASGCSGVDCAGAANDSPQGGSAAGSELHGAGRSGVGAAGGAKGGGTAGNGPRGGAGADTGGVAAGADAGVAAGADTGGVAAGGAASGADSGGFSGKTSNEVDLPGTASADSEESFKGNSASSGHDDNPLTRWCAADGLPGHFWTLDLGAGHALSRMEVVWEYPYGPSPSAFYLYTVSVSDDQVSFTQVVDRSANDDSAADQVVPFPAGTSARYVRITVTGLPPPLGPSAPYWASFFELHVFGPAAP